MSQSQLGLDMSENGNPIYAYAHTVKSKPFALFGRMSILKEETGRREGLSKKKNQKRWG
jgi:hypothetical protein